MGASYPAGLTSIYGETLTINRKLASLGMPGFETKQALIKCPTADFRLHLNPALQYAYYYDASNSAGARWESVGATSGGSLQRDLTSRTRNGSGTAMDSAATGDRLYLAFPMRIGGIHVEMKSRNDNASVLTANYWNGSAWTDTSAQDGTTRQGKTLNEDGDITWSEKTDWLAAHLGGNVYDGSIKGMSITDADAPATYGYWLQILWSAALASDVEISNIWAINESSVTKESDHGYMEGVVWHPLSFDRRNVGAIQAFLDDDNIEEAELKITWLRTTLE